MLPLLWSGILSRCEESVKRMPVLRASAKVKGVLVSVSSSGARWLVRENSMLLQFFQFPSA